MRCIYASFCLFACISNNTLQAQASSWDRTGPAKTLNGYFPFLVPPNLEQWKVRSEAIRQRILVANGLWPEPVKQLLSRVIHGKMVRDGYTIEKVYFQSHPGHYVTGNLYRPQSNSAVPRAGVLVAHGHWRNGRFEVASAADVQRDLASKAERTQESAKYFMQALPVGLVRQGYVVFQFDMVGYADSTAIPHGEGFTDALAELHSQNLMGLQTWNCIRAYDFLSSLPDVDAKRIGVTGASGGGTQTFILGAIDPRPAAIFPAVMVSTAMQGGCICENCSHLRVGTGNVEMAALFAPKPLAMSGADDWTKEIETKGLPQLQQLYQLYGKPENVQAKAFTKFPHNYNQVAREMMTNWFNLHLQGKKEAYTEAPFTPVDPKELKVFDTEHPRPKDEKNAVQLRQYLTQSSEKQFRDLLPKDVTTLNSYRQKFLPPWRVLCDGGLPEAKQVTAQVTGQNNRFQPFYFIQYLSIQQTQTGDQVPAIWFKPEKWNGTTIVYSSGRGKDQLIAGEKLLPEVNAALTHGVAVLAIDVLEINDNRRKVKREVDPKFAGYTFGYNRTLLAERVQDVLTTIAYASSMPECKTIHVMGVDGAGPWVCLASALAGDVVKRTAVNLLDFQFEKIISTSDPMFLPGALKYGGIQGAAALIAPRELLWVQPGKVDLSTLKSAYLVNQQLQKVEIQETKANLQLTEWLVR